MKWRVYILLLNNLTYYIGITTNLPARVNKHNSGKGSKYVNAHRPATLLWFIYCENKSTALKIEYRLKQLTHAQKAAIVEVEYV